MELPGQGSDPSCSHRPGHGCANARSLTHCAGLEIEPASQCSQDTADPTAPQREFQNFPFCSHQHCHVSLAPQSLLPGSLTMARDKASPPSLNHLNLQVQKNGSWQTADGQTWGTPSQPHRASSKYNCGKRPYERRTVSPKPNCLQSWGLEACMRFIPKKMVSCHWNRRIFHPICFNICRHLPSPLLPHNTLPLPTPLLFPTTNTSGYENQASTLKRLGICWA